MVPVMRGRERFEKARHTMNLTLKVLNGSENMTEHIIMTRYVLPATHISRA